MKKSIQILMISMGFMLFSCAGEEMDFGDDFSSNIAAAVKEESIAQYEASVEEEYTETAKDEVDVINTHTPNKKEIIERKLIKEGNIGFETQHPDSTEWMIENAAKKLGGYIAGNTVYQYNTSIHHTMIVRIPSDQFDVLIEEISLHSEDFDEKNLNVKDVTEEFIDAEARLKTKKNVEERYLNLLNKAYSVGDILAIESELSRIREEIEVIEGRLKYLSDKVTLSTLTINFYQELDYDEQFEFTKKIGDGLENGYEGFLWFIIGLINLWPLIIVLTALVYWLIRYRRKRRLKKS